MRSKRYGLALALTWTVSSLYAVEKELPDIRTVQQDLKTPSMVEAPPGPGKRVKMIVSSYQDTEIYHSLYLPTDWKPCKKYPVIVEYPGNGPYRNRYGDTCSGKLEHCNLGYGISGGQGVVWVCLPFISENRKHNQLSWWGDAEATADYCKAVVRIISKEYGGDSEAIFLAGFSRGSIACNFIGLRDDDIANLWRGFICHSHYDGVTKWDYDGSDRRSAAARLERLKNRPQFISHEGSIRATRQYLEGARTNGNVTFQVLSYRNHTDRWVLRDIPERKAVREWFSNVLKNHGQTPPPDT